MIQQIPVQYLCSENNYHFSRFTHKLGREVPTLLNTCLLFYAKNTQLLQKHLEDLPAELIQQIYNHMIGNNLLAPKDLPMFINSMHQMTIDGSVENGEDFLTTYCSVQNHRTSTNNILHEEDTQDESNTYFNINSNGNNTFNISNNNYFYGDNDYHLQVLFGKSIQTSLFDLKQANMVTDLALDDFEDDQVLKKLPANLKHLSVRWCKLSGSESLAFLNDYSHTLQSLRLSSVELKSLTFLSELVSLTFLDLSINPGIKDSEISCLSKLSRLTTLDLDATGISNDVMPMITQAHPKLVCLNLSGTSVTNQGLEKALELQDLKVISVMSTHCTYPYPSNRTDVIIVGDYMTKKDARDAAQYSSYFSRAVQLRLIFGYYKLVANSRSRPHWPWFVQNILDMVKSSIRNDKLIEIALLFLWGEVCGEAMPEDLLNVAHKPVIASVTTICEYGGINTISKIMEYYVKNQRAKNVLLFAIGLLTVASHNNKMSQTLMYQNNIVPLVLEAFQVYENTEPNFQKFVLGVLIQLSANVQCNSQLATKKVVQMCVTDCLNVREYVRTKETYKFVLTLRSMAVLYNLSCWEFNTTKLLDFCILESISEILSTAVLKQDMANVLEASSYFEPLAVGILANLCRKGVCTMYSYNRWKKVIGLAIKSFKEMMKHNQLQFTPPTNTGYEYCSINDWDLARSLVALFINCLTVEPRWAQLFRSQWVDTEIIGLLLQYAPIADPEGHILLALLFCFIIEGDNHQISNQSAMLEQIKVSKCKMSGVFPQKFSSYTWTDVSHVHSLLSSKTYEIREWCLVFLKSSTKANLRCHEPLKRPNANSERTYEPLPKRLKPWDGGSEEPLLSE